MWTFHISTGLLTRNGLAVSAAYAGRGEGKNNSTMCAVPKVGPLPTGTYRIGDAFDSPDHGPCSMRLTPTMPVADMHGRSGFLIHADSILHPGEASEGCIVPMGGRAVRHFIATSKDCDLTVEA
jgi:hypothetical protein